MIRVLIADDEPLMRAGIKAILGTADDIELVAEAGDGREAVQIVRERRVDVAVLDIRMPRMDGLACARELRTVAPAVRVVMLTTFGEDENIVRALSERAPMAIAELGIAAPNLERIVHDLVDDGLIELDEHGRLRLPS